MEAILQAHPDGDTARAARNVLGALQQPVRLLIHQDHCQSLCQQRRPIDSIADA